MKPRSKLEKTMRQGDWTYHSHSVFFGVTASGATKINVDQLKHAW